MFDAFVPSFKKFLRVFLEMFTLQVYLQSLSTKSFYLRTVLE